MPMFVCVEMLGKTLMVHHFAGLIVTPALCRLVSFTDAFMPVGRTRVQVIWTMSVSRLDNLSCQFTNSVVLHPTREFMDVVTLQNLNFRDTAAAHQREYDEHTSRETPLFAGSIEESTRFEF